MSCNPLRDELASSRIWNGLISEIAHQRTDTGTVITNGYFYDHAGRLTDHIRYDGSSQTNRYTERDLSFDRNGNILTLKRYDTNVAAPQDNLAYTYEGNKLMQLNSATYQYDANGNMTRDGRRGLTFSWNHLNLPATISNVEDEDATVNYTYLADGTKVLAHASGTNEGYAYLGTMTYKRSGNGWVLESVPFTGGRFIANATGGMDEYRYITDHLGSTRVIVTGTDYHEVEHNNYYPFGKRISDNTLPTTQNNRWRFSGKEIQTLGGINLIDFGSRLYDNDAVNWKSQDPMAESYFGLTPYGYCGGNPVNAIDPNGRDIYMLFYVTDNKMFKASAETRKREIERMKGFDSEKDIVIMFEFSDLSEIGDMANRIIDTYSEQYGQTAEVGVWSHAGWDGPIGAIQTSGDYALAYSQMSLEGWNSINFNWNSDGANMSFYGCNTGNDNNSGQRGGSFARNISEQSNFKGVNVWGQQTSSYPSFSPYIRVTSFARTVGYGYGIGNTYMVGGNYGQGKQALWFMRGKYPRANPMNVYKNGRLVRSTFQNR